MTRLEKLMQILESMRKNRPTLCHKIGGRMWSLNTFKWAIDTEYKPEYYNEVNLAKVIERIEKEVIIWTQEYLERKGKS